MSDFEIFKDVRTRTKVFISITDNKTFGLPRTFMDKFNITKDHKVVLIYSKSTNKVALHFSTNNPDFGLAVRVTNPKHGAIIVARSFFDLKNIDATKFSGRYTDFEICKLSDLGINKDGEAYVISLKEHQPTIEHTKELDTKIKETIGDTETVEDEIGF